MRLYVAHRGSLFAAWKTEPPRLTRDGKCPKFEPPAYWHDRVVGDVDNVVRTMVEAKIFPKPSEVVLVPQEWAQKGVELGTEAKAKKRGPVYVGTAALFTPEWNEPVNRDGWRG